MRPGGDNVFLRGAFSPPPSATRRTHRDAKSPAFFVSNVTSIDNATIAATAFSITGKKVSLTNGVKADITVCSIDGRTLQSAYASEIDLSTMASILYVVTATTADGRVASAKVIM